MLYVYMVWKTFQLNVISYIYSVDLKHDETYPISSKFVSELFQFCNT